MPYTPPERYRHTNPITIRFADMDAMGHVNNAVYLTYFETARMNYMHDVCGVGAVQHNGGMHGLGDIRGASMILAKMTVEYKLPLVLGDEIVVYIRCSHIGNKSFELDAVIMRYKDGKTEPAAPMITPPRRLSLCLSCGVSASVPMNRCRSKRENRHAKFVPRTTHSARDDARGTGREQFAQVLLRQIGL
jgi:acyl-CoA thioester hydrolase